MKTFNLVIILSLFVLTSCVSVHVNTDYDKKANFSSYKTFAYNKTSFDKLEISDLDKKRILYAIDEVMPTRGFTKSENPDIIINVFTKEKERTDVYNNFGWGFGGFGWGGNFGMNFPMVINSLEGTLFIDFVDAKTKEMVWQGIGTGYLTTNTDKKDARTKEFVLKILEQYPPLQKK